MTERRRNDGLRKVCSCPRRSWAKCEHPWHFNFKWAGETYRFTLDRVIERIAKGSDGKWRRDRASLGDRINDKTTAEKERDRLRTAIREGTLQQQPQPAQPQSETLTVAALFETYKKQYLGVHRGATLKNTTYIIGAITRTILERADGTMAPFGEWLAKDVTTDVIEHYRLSRLALGATGTNRHLELLRGLFNWASSNRRRLVQDNPFLDGAKAAVKLAPELARHRRLLAGEGERLLSTCGSQLRPIVEAAIETGCRRGELLSLQWSQVRLEGRAELFLPAVKTKTKTDRTVPISTRLQAILAMRRNGPDGLPLPGDAHVFGNELGEPVKGFKRAWERAVLVSHGHRPTYRTKPLEGGVVKRTAALSEESRAALRAINLHFHDLRREAGSRWLDAGVPLHRIQKWLGHANISQTSTYLMADSTDDDAAMRAFETRRASLQRIATDSQTEDLNTAQAATIGTSETQLSSTKHH